MIDVNAQDRITSLEREVFALRSELRSLRAELRQGAIPQNKMRHQTPERNLAPAREPEALTDVAQQLSEQVSMQEIGAYLQRSRVKPSDIQLTEQDLERNRPRNRRAYHGYPSKLPFNLEAISENTKQFFVLVFLIGLLVLLLMLL